MTLHPVRSSNVTAIGYNADTRTLVVRFASGGTYRYRSVSPEQHSALVAAESIGGHLVRNISRNPAHPAEKVDPKEAEQFAVAPEGAPA